MKLYLNIMLLFYYGILPAAWIHGALLFNFGIAYFQSIYQQFMLVCFIFFVAKFSRFGKISIILFIVVISSYALSTFHSLLFFSFITSSDSVVIENARYLLRSPIIIFSSFLVSTFILRQTEFHINLFRFVYTFVVLSVAAHYFFGVGGVINNWGNLRDYYSSYFTSGNSIIFVFCVSYFMVHSYGLRGNSTFLERKLLFILTMMVLIFMNSTSAPILIVLLHILRKISPLSSGSADQKFIKSICLLFIFVLAISNLNSLMGLAVMLYSLAWISDPASLEWRLLNFDVISVISSTRDLKFLELKSVAGMESFPQIMFGGSFALQQTVVFVESDFIDIYFALGVMGLVSYLIVFGVVGYLLYARIKTRSNRSAILLRTVFYYIILQAIATGHVLNNPISGYIVGMIFALIVQGCRSQALNKLSNERIGAISHG